MSDSYTELAQRIGRLERRSKNSTPQLTHSTIEGGALQVRANGGQLTAIVGQQYDGTFGAFTVAGPKPPTPTIPTVEPAVGGALVTVPGTWEVIADNNPGLVPTPTSAPMDFLRYEVHASPTPDFSALMFDTLKGEVESARGGPCLIALPLGVDHWVRVVARTRSGAVGAPSTVVGPVAARKIVQEELDVDFSKLGGNEVFLGVEEPTTDKIGDLWLEDTTQAGDTVQQFVLHRWGGVGVGWVELADQGATAAVRAAEAAQAAAETRAELFSQPEPPTGLTATDKGIWIDTDNDNRSSVWTGATWEARLIGNGAIQPQSLVASDVIATGTVSAALLEAIMILATTIILGNQAGVHTTLTETGVQVYQPSPLADTEPYLAISMGDPTGQNTFGVAGPDGSLLANIDRAGVISGRDLYVAEDPTVMGRKLLGDWMSRPARGTFAYGDGRPDKSGIIAEQDVMTISFVPPPGRHLRFYVSGLRHANEAASGAAYFRLRDQTATTYGFEIGSHVSLAGGTWIESDSFVADFPGGMTEEVHTIHLTVAAINGGVHVQAGARPYRIAVDDCGPAIGGGGSTIATTATVVESQQNYVWQENPTWSQSYRQDGQVRTNAGGSLYQGYGDSFNGNNQSLIGFNDVTGVLAGATVTEVSCFLRAGHWYNGAGGTLRLGAHALTSQPATFSGTIDPGRMLIGGWPRATGRWIDLTPWAAEFQGGSVRGLVIGPAPNNDYEYYGQFNGHTMTEPPILRIAYTK